MLGHILGADDTDPIKLATVDAYLKRPSVQHKRFGRPRIKWLDDNFERAFFNLLEQDYNPEDTEHQVLLLMAAFERDL